MLRQVALAALVTVMGLQAASAQPAHGPAPQSGPWIVLGGGFTAVRRSCQTCDEETPARHTGSLVGDIGYAVDQRTTVGAEIAWIPVRTAAGRRSTTHVDALAQFRPWPRHGFFVKGGVGMAFVRHALDEIDERPATAKALSLVLGAGWIWRPAQRITFQAFGTQHAAALGDLQTAGGTVNDVLTNAWSTGLAIVVR